MTKKTFCPNSNHGRLNVAVNYCPNCGATFHAKRAGNCDHAKHMSMLKERSSFCHECGKKLTPQRS